LNQQSWENLLWIVSIAMISKHLFGLLHIVWRELYLKKKLCFGKSSFKRLVQAADDAFLIEGILNLKNPPKEVNEQNKNILCGLQMKYVKGGKDDSDDVHMSSCICHQ